MDLIMKYWHGGEEVVPYDFEFNVGSGDQCDFEITAPMDADIGEYFYISDYAGQEPRWTEFAGYVTEKTIYTNQKQVVVKGKTLRYYLRAAVCGWVGNTERTISGGDAATVFGDLMGAYYDGPSNYWRCFGGGSINSFKINRFDSIEQAIGKGLAAHDYTYIPFHDMEPGETQRISFLIRDKVLWDARVDNGFIGGRGEGSLHTRLGRKVAVIAAGKGEQSERVIRTVWWDGYTWHIINTGAPPKDGYEIYYLDYPNAETTELVNKSKEICMSFFNTTNSMSASNLEFDTPTGVEATLGDIVAVSGAFEHSAIITGKILRRTNMYVTEEYTYSQMEAESTRARGEIGVDTTFDLVNVTDALTISGDLIFANDTARNSVLSGLFLNNTVVETDGAAKTVATGTNTDLVSVTLEPGTYSLQYSARFAANASGRRAMWLATSSGSGTVYKNEIVSGMPAPTGATYFVGSTILTITSTTTLYLIGYQASGSSLSCTGYIKTLLLHP